MVVSIKRNSDGFYWNGSSFFNNGPTPIFNAATGTTSWNYAFALPADGSYTVQSLAKDAAGATEALGTGNIFTIDTVAPALPTVTSPPGPVLVNTANFTVTGTAEANALVKVWVDANNNGVVDAGDTVAAQQQLNVAATSFSISTPLTANTANHFLVTATDAALNQSAAKSVPTITQDSIVPAAPATVYDGSVTGVDADFTTSATTLSANWTASTSGDVAGYEYAIGTTSGGTQVLVFTDVANVTAVTRNGLTLTSGTKYFVSVRAYDFAGNRSTAAISDGIVVDTVAPTSAVTSPGSASPSLSAISGTASDTGGVSPSGVQKVEVSIKRNSDNLYWNGSSFASATEVFNLPTGIASWSYSLSLSAEGSYTARSRATDNAGNVQTLGAGNTFTIDNTPPVVASVTAPTDGAIYSAATPPPANFTGSAADNATGAGLNSSTTQPSSVTFTLQRLSDNQYWNDTASAWQAAPTNLPAAHAAQSGATAVSWSTNTLPPWTPDAYRVQATATDKAGNSLTGSTVNFTYTGPNSPTALGTDSNNGPSKHLFVINANLLVGNTIFVTVAMDPAADDVTVFDTAGNTYTMDATVIRNGTSVPGVRTLVFSAPVTHALTSGTITVTNKTALRNMAATFFSFPDLVSVSLKDQVSTGTGNSATPNSGNTPTTLLPDELLIGAIGAEDKNAAVTAGGSFVNLAKSSVTGGSATHNVTMQPEYLAVHSTGNYAASGTITMPTTGTNWAAAIVTYKLRVPSVTSIVATNGSPTRASTVSFTVNFSESVVGVDAGDFTLNTSGVSGAGIASVTGNDGSYTVTVNTGTGPATGTGSIGLNLVDNETILDVDGTPLGGAGTTGAQNGSSNSPALYTIDKAGPTLSCAPQIASANTSCQAAARRP